LSRQHFDESLGVSDSERLLNLDSERGNTVDDYLLIDA